MAMEGPVEDALDEGFHLPSNMSRCLSVLDIVMEDPAAKQFFSGRTGMMRLWWIV